MKSILSVLIFFLQFNLNAQTRFGIHGASFLVIDNSAKLVIENPSTNALFSTGSGGVKTEAEFDQIVWKIGTNTGNYLIPFIGTSANTPIPFTATLTTGGTGTGEIRFSTYPGATWDNDTYRPSDVTHMYDFNTNSINNSLYVIDRFWIIDPIGYSTKPSATFDFTYIDAEHLQIGNAIVEANLGAQRFNSSGLVWGDYLPQGTTSILPNTTTNVPVSSVDFYRSWTLSLTTNPLYSSIDNFQTTCVDNFPILTWDFTENNSITQLEIYAIEDNNLPFLIDVIDPNEQNYYQVNSSNYSFFQINALDALSNSFLSEIKTIDCSPSNESTANYSNGMLLIELVNSKNEEEVIGVFDMSGKLVQQIALPITGENTLFESPLEIASGIYYVKSLSSEILSTKIKRF